MVTLTCTNRGCMKTSGEALLDEETNQAICPECGKSIDNITEFTKRSMKGQGAVKKMQSGSAFVVLCNNCKKSGQPVINHYKATCRFCKAELKLTQQFMLAYKENVKTPKDES